MCSLATLHSGKRLSECCLDLYFDLRCYLTRITVSPASPQGSLELDTVVGRSVDKGTASLSRADPVLWQLQTRLWSSQRKEAYWNACEFCLEQRLLLRETIQEKYDWPLFLYMTEFLRQWDWSAKIIHTFQKTWWQIFPLERKKQLTARKTARL